MPTRPCLLCDQPAVSPRAKYCAVHRAVGRENQRRATAAATMRRWAEWREAGIDPTHGGEAARRRGETIRESNREKPRRKRREAPAE
jgi:hypothetical protein